MSLEAAIEKLNGNIEKLVAQNEEIIGIAKARQSGGTAAASTETKADAKPAKATAKKAAKEDTTGEDGATTKAVLVEGLKGWLNEFGEPGKHPESDARHGALKTVLGKVGGEGFNLKALKDDDQEKIDKLYNWLENTAKKADKGHGIGRLVADPEPEGSAGGDDDDLGV